MFIIQEKETIQHISNTINEVLSTTPRIVAYGVTKETLLEHIPRRNTVHIPDYIYALQKIGSTTVPNLRLTDCEETGILALYLDQKIITPKEWQAHIEELRETDKIHDAPKTKLELTTVAYHNLRDAADTIGLTPDECDKDIAKILLTEKHDRETIIRVLSRENGYQNAYGKRIVSMAEGNVETISTHTKFHEKCMSLIKNMNLYSLKNISPDVFIRCTTHPSYTVPTYEIHYKNLSGHELKNDPFDGSILSNAYDAIMNYQEIKKEIPLSPQEHTKIPIEEIWIKCAEGNRAGKEFLVKSFKEANKILSDLSTDASRDGDYIKSDFKVTWQNGDVYKGHYNIQHYSVNYPYLEDKIQNEIKIKGGLYQPKAYNDTQWEQHISNITVKYQEECQLYLNTHEGLETTTISQNIVSKPQHPAETLREAMLYNSYVTIIKNYPDKTNPNKKELSTTKEYKHHAKTFLTENPGQYITAETDTQITTKLFLQGYKQTEIYDALKKADRKSVV